MVKEMVKVVLVLVVRRYIKVRPIPCWFWSLTHILMMTVSWYVIAGPLQVLPTQLLTTALRKMYAILT